MTHEAVWPLPRWLLLGVCAAWLLPGLIGRDPWRGLDVTTYALMLAMAEGRTSWWAPALGGAPMEIALLPHWLGAGAILALGPWLGDALAARLPFMALLVATLAGVWLAAERFAMGPAAQPLPLAFGGEASPPHYARALADGAVLALVATLGFADLGHQIGPEIGQMACVAWLLAAVARTGARRWPSMAPGAGAPLLALTAFGAPGVALSLGCLSTAITLARGGPDHRRSAMALAGTTTVSMVLAFALGAWQWREPMTWSVDEGAALARLLAWFLWPAWLPALWTLWRWRRQWAQPHIALPLAATAVGISACILAGRSDRALLLALPGAAVLAAFALPTLRRSASAAIDWFTMIAATATAAFLWLFYVAMQTGWPARPASRVAVLAPEFEPRFDPVALAIGVAATVAWMAAVRWRSGRHRPALWKSMVLPAGGITVCWLLIMTLWLPLVDHDRSPRPWLDALTPALTRAQEARGDREGCVATLGLPTHMVAALESMGAHRIRTLRAPEPPASAPCAVLLTTPLDAESAEAEGWTRVAMVPRPTRRQDVVVVMRRH